MRKIIWITGASSGFGMATALKLLRETEHTICVSARRIHLLDILVKEGALAFPMDVADSDEIKRTHQMIEKEVGIVDAVLVNAGFGVYGPIEAVPENEMRRQFEVNVFGAVETIRVVLPSMRWRREGRIVITSSSAAHISSAGMGYYAATKHSIKAIGTALRQEVKNLGVEVVMVEPGVVKTSFGETAFNQNYMEDGGADYSEQMGNMKAFMMRAFNRAPEMTKTRDIMYDALLNNRVKSVYRTTRGSLALNLASKLLSAKFYDNIVEFAVKKMK